MIRLRRVTLLCALLITTVSILRCESRTPFCPTCHVGSLRSTAPAMRSTESAALVYRSSKIYLLLPCFRSDFQRLECLPAVDDRHFVDFGNPQKDARF